MQQQEMLAKHFSKKPELLRLQEHTMNHCFPMRNYQYCVFCHQYYIKLELKNHSKHINLTYSEEIKLNQRSYS